MEIRKRIVADDKYTTVVNEDLSCNKIDCVDNTVRVMLNHRQAYKLMDLDKTVFCQEITLSNGLTTEYFYVEVPFDKIKEIL